ncbi:MAG: flavodoxin family protein [Candidatus Pacebacteria bacterium]|nr:flavodoxin family protein [Candidatus Paceibacterota bacterium]
MLVIYAHPNKLGHCGYILKTLEAELAKRQVEYQLIDLYQLNYDPVMKPEEHYTSGHKKIAKDTAKFQKLIKNEDKFIFIYPTWWNCSPAILKGFFDRVLTSDFAFNYDGSIPKPLLKGKALVFTSTGSPEIYERLMAGNRSLKLVINDTLNFCGIKGKGVVIGNARKLTDKNKNKIEEKIKKSLSFLKI